MLESSKPRGAARRRLQEKAAQWLREYRHRSGFTRSLMSCLTRNRGVDDGAARAEPLRLAVRKGVEEVLEAEVAGGPGCGHRILASMRDEHKMKGSSPGSGD